MLWVSAGSDYDKIVNQSYDGRSSDYEYSYNLLVLTIIILFVHCVVVVDARIN